MRLIGSTASPYVRRIRILLHQMDKDFDFEKLNVFSDEDLKQLQKFSPTNRVPVLIDGETIVWDSFLITEYLLKIDINLEIKKELFLINEMTDSGIQVFQQKKFDIDPEAKNIFSHNNLKRISQVLLHFENSLPKEELVKMWLYCTLDWFNFRGVLPWSRKFPQLNDWIRNISDTGFGNHHNQSILNITAPYYS